jgi:hypothetical protein
MTQTEIAQAQNAYKARPFAVRWVDSHVSTTNRFHTFDEAFQYAQDMWRMIRREVGQHANMSSNLWWSNLETPEGTIRLAYYFLADDVSSYYRG